MAVTVYQYGVHYRWTPPEALRTQLWLAHNLREDLVSLQHDHEDTVRSIWSSYPAVAAAETELASADKARQEAQEKVAAERARQQTRRITGPAAAALRDAKQRTKDARSRRRDAIGGVRDEANTRLRDANSALKAAQKALYKQYCQDGELYWATFNAVLDHHKTAVKRVQQARRDGRPAQMRHHRFDGTGTVAVQLQRQSGQPQRNPATIADTSGSKWRNVLTLPWIAPGQWEPMSRAEQRQAGRVAARMRCGPGHIDIPLQMHRMLPGDADITGAQLTVRRVGADLRAHLSVTAKLPEPEPVADGPTVALHLGWLDEDDGIRVATWRATAPLDIPHDMQDVFHPDPGNCTGRVLVPHRVADRVAATDQIRSDRDKRLDETKAALVEWLRTHGPVPHPTRDGEQVNGADVARWRAPGRFAVLAQAWRNDPPTGGAEMATALETWRAADKHDWQRQEHGRNKVLGHRDALYRNVAAVIADQAGTLVVDDTSVADLARLAKTDEDLPSEVIQQITHRRTVAAPGTLREAAVTACIRDGIPVITVPAKGLSRIHAGCGHQNPADQRHHRPILCDGCGKAYDPDASATVHMLTRAAEQPPPAADTARSAP